MTSVQVAALRALLRAESAEEVASIVAAVLRDMGVELVVPTGDGRRELPIDVSFGVGPPLVPRGEPETLREVAAVLPAMVGDAHVAMARLAQAENLEETATSDPLTGLPNRRIVTRVLGRLHPGDAVAMVDLDHFKQVNDQRGHDVGDTVLRSFATALRDATRAADIAARIGGEEFVVIMFRTDLGEAVAAMERLRGLWRERVAGETTFSAGVAMFDADGPDDVLHRADQALYRAKVAGRDRIEVDR